MTAADKAQESSLPQAARAPLVEVFYSIQGEGRHVGVPMAFVRTATCPIRCRYCDTSTSYKASPEFRISCGDAIVTRPNPAQAADALAAVELAQQRSAYAASKRVVSVTGGEPLVFPRFVTQLGERLKAGGGSLHLETAALDAAALAQVLPEITHLSADYKLRGTVIEGDTGPAHVACLDLAASSKVTIDVKLVVVPGLPTAAIEAALADLRPFRERILLIVQPVTPELEVRERTDPAEISALVRSALDAGFDLRVIPQVHKALGVI